MINVGLAQARPNNVSSFKYESRNTSCCGKCLYCIIYSLDNGFGVSTGFRSPWKPMYAVDVPSAQCEGIYFSFLGDLNLVDTDNPSSKVFRP